MNFGYAAVGLRRTWIECADFKQLELFCDIFLRVFRDPWSLRVANDKVGADGNYFYWWKGSSGSAERWNKQKCAVKSTLRATSWTTTNAWRRHCGSTCTNARASWGSTIRQIRTQIKFARPIANLFSDTSRSRAVSVITTAAVQRIQQSTTSASGAKFGEEKWNRGLVNSHALKGRGGGGGACGIISWVI